MRAWGFVCLYLFVAVWPELLECARLGRWACVADDDFRSTMTSFRPLLHTLPDVMRLAFLFLP